MHIEPDTPHALEHTPKHRLLVFKILLAAISAILTLAAVEGVLRARGYRYVPMRVKMTQRSDWRMNHAFVDGHFEYDPKLIWRPKANLSVFNSQGWRGPELLEHKQKGEFRIFALGDSNTLGWNYEDGPNWPLMLGALIESEHTNCVLVNAGVWGYSSYQGLGRLKEMLRFQPDLVLWCFGANDAQRVGTAPDSAFAGREIRQYRLDRLLMLSCVGQLTLATMDRLSASGSKQPIPRVSPEQFKQSMQEALDTAKKNGAKLVVLTRPFRVRGRPPKDWWIHHAPEYNQITRDFAASNGLVCVDLYALFNEDPRYYSDESHFNEYGHCLAAEYVYDAIRDYLP